MPLVIGGPDFVQILHFAINKFSKERGAERRNGVFCTCQESIPRCLMKGGGQLSECFAKFMIKATFRITEQESGCMLVPALEYWDLMSLRY